MTQEEKAKAYDYAVKEAYIAYKDEDKHLKATLKRIFPELKESEDELTWLTKYIEEEAYCLSMDIRDDEDRIKLKKLKKALAWLEKQGNKTQGKSALEAIKEEKVDNANKIEPMDYGSIDPHFGKPIKNIEPKFYK
jgi:hypothetical protein